jgi:glycosyltransferase involved in cell wall biosynthesis/ribosomal protein S18 acetylase RimI-like enzyme
VNRAAGAPRQRIVHVTTTDISLTLLLGPQLRAFRAAGYEVLGVSAPGPHVPELEAWGIEHVPLTAATRAMDPRRDAAALVELRDLFRRLAPDLVHTHNPKPGLYGRLAARWAGVPAVVNTVHGLYALPEDPFAKRALVYGLERLAATCSDGELVQNPEDVDTLRALRVPEHKLHLLGNGIDLGRFDRARADPAQTADLRKEMGASEGDVVCGVVGRLVWEKGYREVFAAAAALRGSAPHVKVVVIGPTDDEKADAVGPDDIARAEREGGVTFLGMRDDVADLYPAMDLYLLASHREGFPRSAMEAAAMGVPLIVSDIRGGRQVVDDGVTGRLVPVRDAGAIARAVVELAADPAARRAMGAAGQAKARRDFDDRQVIARTLALYERLLGPAPASEWARPVDGVVVRRATIADAERMADLHASRLAEGFLSVLGPRFLRRLYRRVVRSADAFAHVAVERDAVIGFAAAACDVGALYRRFLLRDGVGAGIASAPRALASWRRVLETLRYPAATEDLPEAELLAVAVDPAATGRGVGTRLVQTTQRELNSRGVSRAKVVAGAGNDRALGLYERCGFVRHATISVHDGASSEVLVWSSR